MSRRYIKSETEELNSDTSKIKLGVEEQSEIVIHEVRKLVDYVCSDLDNAICNARDLLKQSTIITPSLETQIVDLSTQLYFVIQGQETLGIHEDLARSVRSTVYNEMKLYGSGTVQERTSKAELATKANDTVVTIYSRAYKQIKAKSDAGYEVLTALKKILSARISESELSAVRCDGGYKA